MVQDLYLREDGQNYKLRLEVEEILRQIQFNGTVRFCLNS